MWDIIQVVYPYVFLVVGFVLLVKGSDVFVEGSSGIARFFRIPSLIIGLTIVAFGTSAPEAAVSISASLSGNTGIAIGNITGSNIFNILVVLGACALIKPIHVEREIMNKDFLLMFVASVGLLAVSADYWLSGGTTTDLVSRGDGIMLALMFCIFLYTTIRSGLKGRNETPKLENVPHPETKTAEEAVAVKKPNLLKNIIMAVLGLAAVIGGGQLVVNGASSIASSFGMSDTLIGVTVVAIGTSLPELVTSIMAARKGESDIAVGNVIGSNIFNILFVIAASSIIAPLTLDWQSLADMIICIGTGIMVYLFCITKKKINRIEGGIMVLIYAAYMAFTIIR